MKKRIVTTGFTLLLVGISLGECAAPPGLAGQSGPAPATETPFTAYPVDMPRLKNIVPLGNLNPPAHTFPTDHIYFFADTSAHPDGFTVFAPGEITIILLERINYDPPQGGTVEDYTIEFRVSRELSGRFGHVNQLGPRLREAMGALDKSSDRVSKYEIAGRRYTSFRKSVRLSIQAGTPLGLAGRNGGYDFWLRDSRVSLKFVNRDWTEPFLNTVCPLAYFTPEIRARLESFLSGFGAPVVPPSYCGKIDFDVPGTAQGVWVRADYRPGSMRPEEIGLALVYSNFNPSKGAISIGVAGDYGWDEKVYTFTPEQSGYRNRDFHEIKPDGNIYYFFCEPRFRGGVVDQTKAILLRMDDARRIRLQFLDHGNTPLPADPRSSWSESASVPYRR